MVLFSGPPPARGADSRATRIGWGMLGVGFVAAAVLGVSPAPYVIELPGPYYDTLGDVLVDDDTVPLIEIPDEQTYPTEGTLTLLTVSILGDPERLPSWGEVVGAWFDPSRTVLPVQAIYQPGRSVDEAAEFSRLQMENSQREAVAAALTELGYEFGSRVVVAETIEGGPAEGVLESGDLILSVNGVELDDVSGLREALAENGVDRPADLVVARGDDRIDVSIVPVLDDSEEPAPIVGVYVAGEYEFPIEVDIQLENVGGPSAGMMFALGIVDKLTPGALTGGARVAGTGEITASGEVGQIGGIRQKMFAARAGGAEWFLAPRANCDDVVGNVPDGIDVVAVATLDEAIDALERIADGADAASLPQCPAS